mmetsp:Transcript_15741/g.39176  ORF Transcript_15741/g.39176 Transcript_15741/m.39176 type:complete len:122 (-) Transcript_15741:66-431(-)
MSTTYVNAKDFNNTTSDDNSVVHTQTDEQSTSSNDSSSSFGQRLGKGVRNGWKVFLDATVLNTHPSGAPIDGMPRLDGEFAKDCVDATVLNKHPAGAPVDRRMGGRFSPEHTENCSKCAHH